jgi:hypothetical protein
VGHPVCTCVGKLCLFAFLLHQDHLFKDTLSLALVVRNHVLDSEVFLIAFAC